MDTQEKPKKFYQKRWFQIVVGLLVIFFIIGSFSPKTPVKQNASNPPVNKAVAQQTVQTFLPTLGTEALATYHTDGTCSESIVLGITKESADAVGKALLSKDMVGISNLLQAGTAIMINDCTKVKVIDTAVGYKQVRILEGDEINKAGWIPSEWLKPIK